MQECSWTFPGKMASDLKQSELGGGLGGDKKVKINKDAKRHIMDSAGLGSCSQAVLQTQGDPSGWTGISLESQTEQRRRMVIRECEE